MSDFIHKRLADAALHGRYEEVRDLVRRGGPALVNYRDVAGYSALHRAAAGGRPQGARQRGRAAQAGGRVAVRSCDTHTHINETRNLIVRSWELPLCEVCIFFLNSKLRG